LGYSARFITSVFTVTNKVEPSGAARTTASVPRLPDAPARFSTTTGRPSRSDSRGPTWRAMRSMPVPGVNGTISLIGAPAAAVCASAGAAIDAAAHTTACRRVASGRTGSIARFIEVSLPR
jgi:hypothetical protein